MARYNPLKADPLAQTCTELENISSVLHITLHSSSIPEHSNTKDMKSTIILIAAVLYTLALASPAPSLGTAPPSATGAAHGRGYGNAKDAMEALFEISGPPLPKIQPVPPPPPGPKQEPPNLEPKPGPKPAPKPDPPKQEPPKQEPKPEPPKSGPPKPGPKPEPEKTTAAKKPKVTYLWNLETGEKAPV